MFKTVFAVIVALSLVAPISFNVSEALAVTTNKTVTKDKSSAESVKKADAKKVKTQKAKKAPAKAAS